MSVIAEAPPVAATKVVVVGLGYVGLPLAIHAAEAGHHVIGIDTDPKKIRDIGAGWSYIEDIDNDRLQRAVATGQLQAFGSAELAGMAAIDGFDVAVIAVPTPLRHGDPDLSYVGRAARLLGRHLSRGATVVLESTSYPGTTEGFVADAILDESGMQPGTDYHLGFSPERIDPGNPVFNFANTPKLVSGTDGDSLAKVRAFYDGIVDRTIPVSSPAVAEFAKIFENVFSQVNIALVNEMAVLAHELHIDIWDVLDAANTKGHSILRHTPGPGVGGHCLPVDPTYLSWLAQTNLGRPSRFIELAQEINDAMPAYVVRRAHELLPGGLRDARVLVLGVSYKPGVGDMRESPALDVVRLLGANGADVTIADPHVVAWDHTARISLDGVSSSAADYDLTVVVTDHDEFDYVKIAETAPLVLDCRRRMPPSASVHSL